MSDEEAFVAKVSADRDSDTPRLVYADWLDENAVETPCDRCVGGRRYGRHPHRLPGAGLDWYACDICGGTGVVSDGRWDRAEFIRVQVEAHRLHPWRSMRMAYLPFHTPDTTDAAKWLTGELDQFPCLPGCPACRLTVLKEREGQLLHDHYDDWTAPVHVAAGAAVGSRFGLLGFGRGFVESAILSPGVWVGCGDVLLAAAPLERVELTAVPRVDLNWTNDGPTRVTVEGVDWSPWTRWEWGDRSTLRMNDWRSAKRLLRMRWPKIRFSRPGRSVRVG